MLTLDECIPYVLISAQTLGKSGVGTVSELSIDNSIHEDEQRGGSVVSDSISQVDFDEYARCFANRHGIAVPSSCDALSRSSVNHHRFFFVEYKGGNIVGRDQKTNVLSIKSKEAKKIEKKLYDSALMLVKEKVVDLETLRRTFAVLVVVRNDHIPGMIGSRTLSPSANPVFAHMQRSIIEFTLRSEIGLAETLYLAVKIVSADTFQKFYLPHFQSVIRKNS